MKKWVPKYKGKGPFSHINIEAIMSGMRLNSWRFGLRPRIKREIKNKNNKRKIK